MKVRNVEKFCFSVLDPLSAGQRLTLWAVAIPTGVECVPFMTAVIAALQMTAENGCPAYFDGDHDAPLPGGHRRAMLFTVGFAIAAEYIGYLQLRAINGPRRSEMRRWCGFGLKGDRARQQVQGTRCRTYLLLVAIRR
jgi:hypothetical protein